MTILPVRLWRLVRYLWRLVRCLFASRVERYHAFATPILSFVSFAPALNVNPATPVPILALVLPRLMSPVEVIYDPSSFPRPLDPFSIGAALLIE